MSLPEDAYKTQIRIDDEPANLDILDTAGQVTSSQRASIEMSRLHLLWLHVILDSLIWLPRILSFLY